MEPSPSVKRNAWKLLAYVRKEIKRGMSDNVEFFHAERPAKLYDELKHFLAIYDSDGKYRGKNR